MTDTPLVSICLPNWNARRFLDARMESILSQTVSDWELIVCDSHSDDGSWEYFERFRGDPRVRLHQVPRAGIYAGWNECLRRARGAYVYIAAADDTCRPELLERLVAALQRQPSDRIGLAVCDFDFIDARGAVIEPPRGTARLFYGDWLGRPHLRSGQLELLVHLCVDISWTTITAVLMRRTLLDSVGLFREDRGAFADRFWAMRSALRSDTVFVPGRLATWRIHERQGSGTLPAGFARNQYAWTRESLLQNESLIPARWREDPRWLDKLLWRSRRDYLGSFGLDRRTLKARPMAFVAGCLRAACREPTYLVQRLRGRLTWDGLAAQEETAYVHRLARDWGVPWPPEEVVPQLRGGHVGRHLA